MENIEVEIERLTAVIDGGGADASVYYNRGRLLWRLGRRGEAMSDYEKSAALDPASPAVEALRMCNDIMDFYNTDLYNP